MATNARGRGAYSSPSTSTRSPYFSGKASNTGWSKTGNWNKTGNWSKQSNTWKRKDVPATGVPAEYKTCYDDFATKINSYRMLCNQTRGPAKFDRPSPTTLHTFANWVNKGAIVQTVRPAQVWRWAKTTGKHFNVNTPSTASCKNVLCAKFGKNTIKAVTRTKTGSFMVATTPTVNGRHFWFPK
jgi:hypothetical protein